MDDCGAFPSLLVLIHMSMGFMMLALTLCLFLLLAMGLSFRPGFKRLSKIDLVFSSLSFSIGKCGPGGRGACPPPPPLSLLRTLFLALGRAILRFCPAMCWVSVFECLLGSLPHSFCMDLNSTFSVEVSVGVGLSPSCFPSRAFHFCPGVFMSVI